MYGAAKPRPICFSKSRTILQAVLSIGQPVNSTSRNPAYTLLDGFLAISFDNLGAGAHLALSIADASHQTQVPRNYRIEHLPARAVDTRTRSAQKAAESTLPEATG